MNKNCSNCCWRCNLHRSYRFLIVINHKIVGIGIKTKESALYELLLSNTFGANSEHSVFGDSNKPLDPSWYVTFGLTFAVKCGNRSANPIYDWKRIHRIISAQELTKLHTHVGKDITSLLVTCRISSCTTSNFCKSNWISGTRILEMSLRILEHLQAV